MHGSNLVVINHSYPILNFFLSLWRHVSRDYITSTPINSTPRKKVSRKFFATFRIKMHGRRRKTALSSRGGRDQKLSHALTCLRSQFLFQTVGRVIVPGIIFRDRTCLVFCFLGCVVKFQAREANSWPRSARSNRGNRVCVLFVFLSSFLFLFFFLLLAFFSPLPLPFLY